MSGHVHPSAHAEQHHAEHGRHGTLRGYLIGFVLAAILTAIPFWLVMTGAIADKEVTALVIMGFAVVQILVHVTFFLHMNTKAEEGWSVMALIFTVVLVVIVLSGSLWVMYHLNHNMMPMTAAQTGQLP
jgi:cytochrome o ubiquinol oxidase operon protein cyoD